LQAEIAKTRDHPGIGGTISPDDKRNAVKPAIILQMKDDKSICVATVRT
jgi:branched-chain amino acid transport system substrate-binding protein